MRRTITPRSLGLATLMSTALCASVATAAPETNSSTTSAVAAGGELQPNAGNPAGGIDVADSPKTVQMLLELQKSDSKAAADRAQQEAAAKARQKLFGRDLPAATPLSPAAPGLQAGERGNAVSAEAAASQRTEWSGAFGGGTEKPGDSLSSARATPFERNDPAIGGDESRIVPVSLMRFVRRNRTWVLAASVVVLAFLGYGAVAAGKRR